MVFSKEEKLTGQRVKLNDKDPEMERRKADAEGGRKSVTSFVETVEEKNYKN